MALLISWWYHNQSWRLRVSFHVGHFAHHILVHKQPTWKLTLRKLWNVEPPFNHARKEITEINPSLTKLMAPFRFMMGSWSGMSASTLAIHSKLSINTNVWGLETTPSSCLCNKPICRSQYLSHMMPNLGGFFSPLGQGDGCAQLDRIDLKKH